MDVIGSVRWASSQTRCPPISRPPRSPIDTRGVTSPALAGVSLFVRSGEIAAVVGLPGAGKSTLLRIVAAHGDHVLIGSADHREPGDGKPGLVRGWRFCDPWDIFAPEWRPEEWRGVPILRYAFPNMALDGSAREPPGCYGASHVDSDGVVHSPPPWQGPPPNDDDLPDLLLVDDLVGNPAFADAAARCAFVRDLHGLRLRPECRTVIYATRDGEDALAVADRIAVLHDGRIVQCGTSAGVHDTPVKRARGAALQPRPCTQVVAGHRSQLPSAPTSTVRCSWRPARS